jgi:hypothetical protein
MCGCPNASETYPTDSCATPSLCVSPRRAGPGDHGYSFPATGDGSTRTQPPSPDSSERLRSSPAVGCSLLYSWTRRARTPQQSPPKDWLPKPR